MSVITTERSPIGVSFNTDSMNTSIMPSISSQVDVAVVPPSFSQSCQTLPSAPPVNLSNVAFMDDSIFVPALPTMDLSFDTSGKSNCESLKTPPELLLGAVCRPTVKVVATGAMMELPPNRTLLAFDSYVNLPSNDSVCGKVDLKCGEWYWCCLCNKKVKNRVGREWTITTWSLHKKEAVHQGKINNSSYLDKIKAIDPLKRTPKQKQTLALASRTQVGMTQFFSAVKSQKELSKEMRSGSASLASSMTLGASMCTAINDAPPLLMSQIHNTGDFNHGTPRSCEGIMPDFNGKLKPYLTVYAMYASVDSGTLYCFDYVGVHDINGRTLVQIFGKQCTRKNGKLRTTKNGSIFSCDICHTLMYKHGKNYRQKIKERGLRFLRVVEFTKKSEITPSELDYANKFIKTPGATLSDAGKELKLRIHHCISFTNYVSGVEVAITSKEKYAPGIDAFLSSFIKHYQSSEEFRGSLIVCLMKAYVAKVNGVCNPKYGSKVLNFYLALCASGDKKAFEYISGNLVGASLRWMQTIIASRRNAPFISLDSEGQVSCLLSVFNRIRTLADDSSLHIAFSVGIDATALVKSFQISSCNSAIVGGASPNHFIGIEDMPAEDIKNILKNCVQGEYGDAASEVKVSVVTIQNTPPGMPPYFVLSGLPQTINENNDFGTKTLEVCNIAAARDGNTVVLNTSTDGVSCEVQDNKALTLRYLNGDVDQVSFPDTNHNVKNSRYQLIGGSSASVIGSYVFDPWLLKMSGVALELIRIEVWANDSLPLRLASPETISKLIACDFPDIGNCAATITSLLFLRLHSFAVNSRTVDWRERAVYSWASLLWFTSFQTSHSTMMTNKRNMVLETIGLLFLVTRSDVTQPRRLTSEANEHTYGCWRMVLREFNMEQLIRIVQKTSIRMDAIFDGEMVISRSKSVFKGYQNTLPDFLSKMACGSSAGGPVNVEKGQPAVNQLWSEVSGIIEAVNSWMIPFLKLFGVENGNGISPFANYFSSASDLSDAVSNFFRVPKADMRGRFGRNVSVGENMESNEVEDERNNDESNSNSSNDNGMSLPQANVIAHHVNEISQADLETNSSDAAFDDDLIEVVNINDEHNSESVDDVNFFDGGNSTVAYDQFKSLLRCNSIDAISMEALKTIELLFIGKLEKGSVTKSSKTKSINERWFNQKTKHETFQFGNKCDREQEGLFIQRDSLIHLRSERGGAESIESYRVLSFFSKYMNKWFVPKENKYLWKEEKEKRDNVRVLARLMLQRGSSYVEAKLEKNGDWASHQIFCIAHFKEILKVEKELVEM